MSNAKLDEERLELAARLLRRINACYNDMTLGVLCGKVCVKRCNFDDSTVAAACSSRPSSAMADDCFKRESWHCKPENGTVENTSDRFSREACVDETEALEIEDDVQLEVSVGDLWRSLMDKILCPLFEWRKKMLLENVLEDPAANCSNLPSEACKASLGNFAFSDLLLQKIASAVISAENLLQEKAGISNVDSSAIPFFTDSSKLLDYTVQLATAEIQLRCAIQEDEFLHMERNANCCAVDEERMACSSNGGDSGPCAGNTELRKSYKGSKNFVRLPEEISRLLFLVTMKEVKKCFGAVVEDFLKSLPGPVCEDDISCLCVKVEDVIKAKIDRRN